VQTPEGAYVSIADGSVTAGNDLVERTWSVDERFGTTAVRDKRTTRPYLPGDDFVLWVGPVALGPEDFTVRGVQAEDLDGGAVRVVFDLVLGPEQAAAAPVAALAVERAVTVRPGVAGFQVDTTVSGAAALTGYTLDEIGVPGGTATLHDFRAGYDWRGSDTPDWEPAIAPFGAGHTGDHRVTVTGAPGEAVNGPAQWMSVAHGTQARMFLVVERVNYASSMMVFDRARGSAVVDLAEDLVYVGPFESDIHLRNPQPAPVR
jgi:hypothetical protein